VSKKQQRYKKYALLPKLRKWTTPVHWLYGGLCVFLILAFGILAGWLGMGAFAILEHWNDKEEKAHNPIYLPTGCTAWAWVIRHSQLHWDNNYRVVGLKYLPFLKEYGGGLNERD